MKLGHNEASDKMGSHAPHLAPRTRYRTLWRVGEAAAYPHEAHMSGGGDRGELCNEECASVDPLYETPAHSSLWTHSWEARYGSKMSPARGRMGLKESVRTFGRGWRFVAHYDRNHWMA